MKTISLFFVLFIGSFIYSQQMAPLKVLVSDFESHPLHGEQILFVDAKSGKSFTGITDKAGLFNISIPGGAVYDIRIKSVGEAQDYNTLEIPAIGPNQMYGENELQIMIEQPKLFTLNNVLFETGKSTIKSSSFSELDELAMLLKLKPELIIEIAGHTDNVGDAESNVELSKNRAVSVKEYLVKKGIASSRIKTAGYGAQQPVADNSTEAGRKQNRRTEVRLLD